jgi:hypothetical protein
MEMFEQHEKYAQLTLWMSGITLLLKSVGVFFKIYRRFYNVIVLIAAIIAAVFLSIAGHHGARLTHIAGVGPMGRYLMKGHGMGGDMKEMNDMEMKGDSAMKMNDKMPGMPARPSGGDSMTNMNGIDNMKKMDMKGMGNMKEMKSTDKMKDMKRMPGMDKMKNMKGMDDMSNMKDMKDMKDMKNMPGIDTMKNMKGMDNMKDMKDMKGMPGMDSGMNMPARPSGGGDMKNMNMPMKNAMDTIQFPDNNPAQKKSKKPGQE